MDELLLTAPCLAACAASPLSQGKMATESEQRPDSGDPPSEERAPNSSQKPEVDMDNLSKPELLTLLSILEGELEARDLVIETLRSRRKDVFIQERYGRFNLGDPFLALQRDYEAGGGDGGKDKQPICASPLSILEMVMSHCKKMQERMSAQLAAAEIRHRKVILDLEEERHKHAQDAAQGDDVTYMLEKEREHLLQQVEFEKSQLKQLETENKKMSTQFEEERMKSKQLVMMLVKECKQLAGKVVDESQALAEITKTLEDEQKRSSELEEELMNEKKKCVLMEAKMEKQLSEFDIEREQLRAKLNREENRTKDLRLEVENFKKMIELNKNETGSLSSSLSKDFDVGLSRSPSLIPSLMPSGPVPLGGRSTLLHQAAAQGNVTLLSMLLNEDGIDINHLDEEGSSALYSAAKSGYTDFVTLLLNSGAQVDAVGKNLYTPLCAAAAGGHVGCTEVLIAKGANVNYAAEGDETPLYLSCIYGHHECTLILLKAGVDYNTKTINGWTAFHAAVNSGHIDCLKLLMYHRVSGDGRFADESEHKSSSIEPECPEGSDKFRVENMVTADLINHTDKEGWTAAHIAASKGFKNCLEVLCRHSGLDPNRKDKYQRTVHDVATDDCKHLLENWSAHKVLLQISMKHSEQISSSTEHVEKNIAVGSLIIYIQTTWDDLSRAVTVTLKNHYKDVMHGWELPETSTLVYSTEYDFISSGISAIAIGDEIWMPGHILTASPWSLIKWSQNNFVTVFLNVLQEGFLDSIAYASLIPVCILQNYLRLVEQYRNVIFHGPVGSCQDHVAHQVANCIKHKQEAIGSICEIIQIEMETSLSKDQLVELFIQRGILVPLKQSFVTEKVTVVLMKNLETAASLSEFLGELLDALENRGAENAFTFQHVNGNSDTYYFKEDSFLIGTMTKTKLQSSDLMVQQHFRWVQLRWDVEPISGLLQRFLKRQVIHKFQGQLPAPSDPVRKAVQWVCTVWYQLNSYLSRLGTPEALIGPRDFFSCPIMPGQVQPIMSWMANLWNKVIAPGVEEAILSRASVKKSRQRQPVHKSLNQGQQAVVKAALSILLNKAVLHGCSLSKQELEECASEFQGWHFPLTMISSYKTSKKKIENDAWRKVSTTPHKKSAHSVSQSWNKLKGNREGIQLASELPKNFNELNTAPKLHSLENNPLRTSDLEQGLSLYTDEDEDLISELQSMCLSKSESDISKIDMSKDLFFMIPGSQRDQSSLRTLKDHTAHLPATKVSDCTLRNGTPTSSNNVKRVSRLGLSRVKSHLPVLQNNAHRIHHSSSNTRHLESNNNTSMEIWKLGKTVHDANNNK
ncbi:cortactin-binding protein 2 isoform X4 [Mobula birostris]|uniref:cortactin-binding protein 2 isoform X4 n=1 Tax=Mobula birostris TaxID=1983395 RepID=UPI003B2814D4